jgi:hypothetical protein
MVVEVDDLKSSEGTEMPSKCTGSDMKAKKGFKPRVKIEYPSLDLALYLVDYKKTDDPDWEEWRNSLKMTIGGHTFGGAVFRSNLDVLAGTSEYVVAWYLWNKYLQILQRRSRYPLK